MLPSPLKIDLSSQTFQSAPNCAKIVTSSMFWRNIVKQSENLTFFPGHYWFAFGPIIVIETNEEGGKCETLNVVHSNDNRKLAGHFVAFHYSRRSALPGLASCWARILANGSIVISFLQLIHSRRDQDRAQPLRHHHQQNHRLTWPWRGPKMENKRQSLPFKSDGVGLILPWSTRMPILHHKADTGNSN